MTMFASSVSFFLCLLMYALFLSSDLTEPRKTRKERMKNTVINPSKKNYDPLKKGHLVQVPYIDRGREARNLKKTNFVAADKGMMNKILWRKKLSFFAIFGKVL